MFSSIWCICEAGYKCATSKAQNIERFKAQMMQEFDMANLGRLAYFLGL